LSEIQTIYSNQINNKKVATGWPPVYANIKWHNLYNYETSFFWLEAWDLESFLHISETVQL